MLVATKVAALLLFTSGFLLTRVELPNKSACGDFRAAPGAGSGNNGTAAGGGCWIDTPIDKLVLLIIDGARFDFAHVAGIDRGPPPPLTSIGEILNNNNTDGRGAGELFKFVADPPTTTQQRLKGLLTGGLPTFMVRQCKLDPGLKAIGFKV